MELSVDIRGQHQLLKFLEKFPVETRHGIRQGTRAATKIVLAQAKAEIPVDEGTLQKSLVVRTAKGKRGRRLARHLIGHAVVTDRKRFPGQFYGTFIEFGTKNIDAFQTLRESIYTTTGRTFGEFTSVVRRGIAKAVRKTRWKNRYSGNNLFT